MNRRQITYFLGVADAESFSRAAERLHISQSALSARIGELEKALGATLFERRPHGVTLTLAGQTLLPHARDIVEAFERASRAMEQPKPVPLAAVRIGVIPTVGATILPMLLEVSEAMRLDVDWHAQQAASLRLLEMLEKGELDAALSYVKPTMSGVRSYALYSDDMVLVGKSTVLHGADSDIGLAELAGFELVLDQKTHPNRQVIDAAMARMDVALHVLAEIEPLSAKKRLVLDRGLCTIVPRQVFAQELASGVCLARRIVSPRLPRTLHLLLGKGLDQHRCSLIRSAMDEVIIGMSKAFTKTRTPADARYSASRP